MPQFQLPNSWLIKLGGGIVNDIPTTFVVKVMTADLGSEFERDRLLYFETVCFFKKTGT